MLSNIPSYLRVASRSVISRRNVPTILEFQYFCSYTCILPALKTLLEAQTKPHHSSTSHLGKHLLVSWRDFLKKKHKGPLRKYGNPSPSKFKLCGTNFFPQHIQRWTTTSRLCHWSLMYCWTWWPRNLESESICSWFVRWATFPPKKKRISQDQSTFFLGGGVLFFVPHLGGWGCSIFWGFNCWFSSGAFCGDFLELSLAEFKKLTERNTNLAFGGWVTGICCERKAYSKNPVHSGGLVFFLESQEPQRFLLCQMWWS